METTTTEIRIDKSSQIPVYKQIINAVQEMVRKGSYHKGDFLPSMNVLSNDLAISKESVKKAYSILREKGVIESTQGKGFYVTNNDKNTIRILLLFDKISTYKQVLYGSFIEAMGDAGESTVHLHNQDVSLFEKLIEENLDNFDFYIITPHFPLIPEIQKQAIKILKKIPNRKLLLLDRNLRNLPGNFGAIYQDFENDIYEGLLQEEGEIRKYRRLNVVSMAGSLYAPLIEKGIKRFCNERNVPVRIHRNINIDKINKNEVFLILNSQLDIELIKLSRVAREKGCVIGKDIGIISYNDSPINEIVLNGLTAFSTDFKQMGYLAAKMIKEKMFKKTRCDFHLIRRSTY
jgi:DNA-binding transcriptional regulator YhcF (GntR family)